MSLIVDELNKFQFFISFFPLKIKILNISVNKFNMIKKIIFNEILHW